MDARESLRRYLEQRREAGETELVLDGLTVEQVMHLLGAGSRGVPIMETGPDWRATLRRDEPSVGPADVVDPARPAGSLVERVSPPPPPRASVAAPAPVDEAGPPLGNRRDPFVSEAEIAHEGKPAPAGGSSGGFGPDSHAIMPLDRVPSGLVVGGSGHELFGGPAASFAVLDDLTAAVVACTRCALYKTARRAVPGEGNPHAQLMCVGEAPGAVEDETGRPFVGPAGQLLDKILAAVKLSRNDVFICNVLKHRPPGNRNPLPDEVEACSPYLIRQIELIKPSVIVAFGTFAAQTLLNTRDAIGKLRGRIHRYYGVPLVVTYHPAALLRNPGWKRPTWEDVQLARRLLDRAVSD